MKTKKKVLIGLMSVCLIGSIGSALALTRNSATASGQNGAFDKAVYLYWGHESSTVTLTAVENLRVNTPVYRYLEVSPKSTKTVAGNVKLDFTLAASAGNHHIEGLTINVYKTNSLADDEHVASLINGVSAQPSLSSAATTGSTNLAITTSSSAHETVGYYAIEIVWDGSRDNTAGHEAYTLDGNVTIAQSFVAA